MMEIPESYVVSKQLKDLVLGKKVTKVIVGHSPHKFAFFSDDLGVYDNLVNKKIEDIYPVANQLEFKLEDYRLLFGDGAAVRYLSNEEKAPAKHNFYMELDDGSKIYTTVQMYGSMIAFKENDFDNFYYKVATEKPSPLSDEFDFKYFDSIINAAKPSISVKALLATEQRIPGLGNGVLHDILFNAGINPQTKISFLSQKDKENLFNSVKSTLLKMVTDGGRDTEKDIYKKDMGYKTILSNKTLNNHCPKCSAEITRKAYLGGNVYFCPTCQPVMK